MQRVSIGRAIVREPRIFLMDEPLSNLDAKLRESLRVELQHLQKTLGSTTLFVTHDQIEALTMADRIAVLNEGRIIQDPYSIRCAPQVLGAARDALTWTRQVLQRELNSVNDNPIVDPEDAATIFAGNFYGGHVALTMDLVKTAAASVADLIARQYALLVDSRLNVGLPETLVAYEGCGLKALQLTCSALAARAVQRSAPDTVLSRPTEVSNQDKVSMGLNAALNAAEITTLVQQVLATLMVALSNAAALRDETRLSPEGQRWLAVIRSASPLLTNDRRLDGDLQALMDLIDQGKCDF